ncbi:MAG TPA: MIP/aquaporin family protein [Terriglobia bacterium]|nr:MIP/aquaporin family protein [Terriglobia bacterium]
MSVLKKATCEFVGTGMLLIAIVGSGIMGQNLSGGNIAIALLCNSVATGGALVALILTYGPVSGAHLNPVVTIADAIKGGISWRIVPAYLAAQFLGGLAGVSMANTMFGYPALFTSTHVRSGTLQFVSEIVASFGLLTIIHFCAPSGVRVVAPAVAAYITGAYWMLPSTSFANPAVALARGFTDTFSGIRPSDIAGFWIAEIIGAALATGFSTWIFPKVKDRTVDKRFVLNSSRETNE